MDTVIRVAVELVNLLTPGEDRGRQFEEGDATEKRSDRLGVGPREATGMDSRPELVLEQSARNERRVP